DSQPNYFCYVGVLHPDRGIEHVIKVIKQIPTVRFIYAGYGPLENELGLLSSNVTNIEFMGRIDYDTALRLEAGALAIVAFYNSALGGNNLYAAPNKLFEALMLGKPLITSEGTLLADIVKSEDIGYVIPFGDEELLDKTLLHIVNNPIEAEQKGKRARYLYDIKYSAGIAKKRLLDIYHNLIDI
ncbi:MAG: glycosyltransferase family 4 protein, partial [Syntrophomonadaceae bacterium]|nr:glycosyltransferase family 4 protein [Syntrophomonadaceae bacterium]